MKRRLAAALALSLLLAGCSWFGSSSSTAGDQPPDDANKTQLCRDAGWKAAHLGLWYNICTRGTAF